MTTNEATNVVMREALTVTEPEYKLYEWEEHGNWTFIRELTFDEANDLMSQWQDFDGYLENDFGIIDQTVMLTHYLLNRVFIMERI